LGFLAPSRSRAPVAAGAICRRRERSDGSRCCSVLEPIKRTGRLPASISAPFAQQPGTPEPPGTPPQPPPDPTAPPPYEDPPRPIPIPRPDQPPLTDDPPRPNARAISSAARTLTIGKVTVYFAPSPAG